MSDDRKELLFGAGLAFTYFVLVKIADWIVGGFALNTFGPQVGAKVHLALFLAAMLAFVVRGILRQRDRFSVLAGLAMLAVPVVVYLVSA